MDRIQFPAEDREWLALQQKVIEVAQKPIEDLERTEIRALSSVFSPYELEQIRTYRKNVGLDVRELPIIVATKRPWTEQQCDKTFNWISCFSDYIRCITTMLELIAHNPSYGGRFDEILKELAPRLFKFIDESGAPRHSDTEQVGSLLARIKINIPKVSPTDDGYNLLAKFHGKLYKQCRKIDKEREQERNPPPLGPWPLPEDAWLFTVEIRHVRAHKTRSYTIWTKDENTAKRNALSAFRRDFPNVAAMKFPFKIERVERLKRGDWNWNRYFENGGKCE